MLKFSLRSLWNRRFAAAPTVLAIALSVAPVLAGERLRDGARDSFASGIDLIVAPRGSSVQILMAAVFGMGGTGTGMAWECFEWLRDRPEVAWAVPIRMGDNHHGLPVIGTDAACSERFRQSGGQALSLAADGFFAEGDAAAAVVGAKVAARPGHAPSAAIINAHGAGDVSFDMHDDAPFAIPGALAPTGMAVDRMPFATLERGDALHAQGDAVVADPLDPAAMSAKGPDVRDDGAEAGHGHEPDRINAVFVGLSDRTSGPGLQRAVNDRPSDAPSAVLPAVALAELLGIAGTAEQVMRPWPWRG